MQETIEKIVNSLLVFLAVAVVVYICCALYAGDYHIQQWPSVVRHHMAGWTAVLGGFSFFIKLIDG